MSVADTAQIPPEEAIDESDKKVAPLELFFDLVFVFALTQVTQLMSENPTWEGLGQGMLVMTALWWAWGAYAWLTNYIAAEEGIERLLMFGVMGALLFAERFGLIVIIALGESIVAIGAGVGSDLDAGIIVAAGFGLVVSCALWWAYFDVWALITEKRFRQARGHARILIARDVYSYLHLPMTAGTVLISLCLKKKNAGVDET